MTITLPDWPIWLYLIVLFLAVAVWELGTIAGSDLYYKLRPRLAIREPLHERPTLRQPLVVNGGSRPITIGIPAVTVGDVVIREAEQHTLQPGESLRVSPETIEVGHA